MGVIKNFIAFIISIVLILLFYYYISIPILPCVSIYAASNLFNNNSIKTRIFFIIISSLFGIYIYSMNAILSIIHYPDHLTIIGIIAEFITVIAFLSSLITLTSAWVGELKRNS